MKRLMDRFFEYFSEQLDAGKTTPLTGSERQSLLLFRDWANMYAPEYAAGPELLAALGKLADEAERVLLVEQDYERDLPHLRLALVKAQVAIAKARGER